MLFRFVAFLLSYILVIGGLLGAAGVVAQAEAIPPRALLEVADFSSPVVSPDGTYVAFRIERASVERNTYDTIWYVQALNGESPPRRLADGGIPLRDSAGVSLPAPAIWSPDGAWIYYRALVDGAIDVWRAATDGSSAQPVTLDPADIRDFRLSFDGATVYYSVGPTRAEVIAAEQAEYDDGIRIESTSPIGQSLHRSGNIEGRLATQRLGTWFNRTALLADVPDRWNALDLTTGQRRDVAPSDDLPMQLTASDLPEGPDRPWRLVHEPRTGWIATLTRVGERGDLRLKPDVELAVLLDGSSRTPIRCVADACVGKAITNIQWRPDTDEVVFTVTDPERGLAQRILRWNVPTGHVHPVTDSTGLLSGGRDRFSACGISSRAMACVAADADRPPRLERIDLETGYHHVLFEPNATLAQDLAKAISPRLLRWTDDDGRVFTGKLFPAGPPGVAPAPLFVTYYRCAGFLRGGVGDEWPLATLAAHGIAALCINAAPSPFDAVTRYNLGLSAVESAIDLLASQGEIDRNRVGMGGLSLGTEVTLWVAMYSDVLAAASVTSPAVTLQGYLQGSLKGDEFLTGLLRTWQLSHPGETPERWRQISPAFNLHRIHAPILMQMPEQEFPHSLDYAIPMMLDHRADVYVFPHEPHFKFQPRHLIAAYQRNLDWFRFWLQGIEDASPAKRSQYVNWRLMRENVERGPMRGGGHAVHLD